eukprot:maker-scaffold310_size212938-snap-gene-0.13 protein:Tk03974 transcript:maker-scaffold310_size212938-snap-gene-0.13-mRNA-1 annotation:"---NA---"
MMTVRHSGSKDCLSRRGSVGMPLPPPPSSGSGGMRAVDFCTLRRPMPHNSSQMNTPGGRRNVQFADQGSPPNLMGSQGEILSGSPRKQGSHLMSDQPPHVMLGPPAYPNPPPAPRHPHPAFMYATLRPSQQRKDGAATFHEFIPPPPPPMFESGPGLGMLPPPPLTAEEKKEKKKRESTV